MPNFGLRGREYWQGGDGWTDRLEKRMFSNLTAIMLFRRAGRCDRGALLELPSPKKSVVFRNARPRSPTDPRDAGKPLGCHGSSGLGARVPWGTALALSTTPPLSAVVSICLA